MLGTHDCHAEYVYVFLPGNLVSIDRGMCGISCEGWEELGQEVAKTAVRNRKDDTLKMTYTERC